MRRPALTQRQLKHYQEEGYVLLGPVMDKLTVAAFRREELRLRGSQLPQDPGGRGEAVIFRSQVCNYSEVVRKYVCGDPLVPLARQLVGSQDLALWFHQFVTKMPDQGRDVTEFPWHQDHGYTALSPATDAVVWIALDDCDEKNGCVWIQPQSHRGGLLAHRRSKASWHLTTPTFGDGVPATLKAGHAVAFTGRTLHRSKLNERGRPRRGFFANYCEASAVTGKDARPVVSFLDRWVVSGRAPVPALRRKRRLATAR